MKLGFHLFSIEHEIFDISDLWEHSSKSEPKIKLKQLHKAQDPNSVTFQPQTVYYIDVCFVT